MGGTDLNGRTSRGNLNTSSLRIVLSASNLPPDVKGAGWGIRHVQCLMLFFSMVLCYSMRVNMSMAIVAMTDTNNEQAFDWSMQTQSVILSSFFWGYVVLQVPGGPMADRFGGSILITICVAVNSLVTLAIPAGALYGNWLVVCAFRVLQGLSQGYLFPCLHNLIGKWVPEEEKSRLGTLIYAGGQCGTALQLSSAGFVANHLGWEYIFYINGLIGVIWTAVFIYVGAPEPQKSKLIGKDEKMYIQKSLGQIGGHKTYPTPWKSMFTSLPFISLIIVHCAQDWGFWTLNSLIPSYMSSVLGVNIRQNGMMSALPYVTMFLLSFPFGYISDYVLTRHFVSNTTARKICNSIGHFGPALFLIGFAYLRSENMYIVVTLLCVVVGLNAGHHTGLMNQMSPSYTKAIGLKFGINTGYPLVHLDMSPNFAGSLLGVTNCGANVVSIFAPLAAGVLLQDESDAEEWKKVFYLTSSIYIVGNSIFLIFGTSKVQKWNDPPEAARTSDRNPLSKLSSVLFPS